MKFGRLSIKFRRRSRLSSINAFRQSIPNVLHRQSPASTAIPANAWDCPQGIIGDHAISKLAISAAVVGAVVIATRFVWSIPQLIFRAGSFPHSSAGIGETEAHGQLRARSFRKGARSFFQSLLWPCL
jgi:hypothetical protein